MVHLSKWWLYRLVHVVLLLLEIGVGLERWRSGLVEIHLAWPPHIPRMEMHEVGVVGLW